MDEPKSSAPDTRLPAPLAEVPDEFPEGLLEPDGTFMPDYDPPVRPLGVWVLAGIAIAIAVSCVQRSLLAVTRADMSDFLINAAAAWAYGFAGYGTFRGNPRGHTTYLVLMLVNLAVCAAATVVTAVIATNAAPPVLRMLTDDPLAQEFLRNAALAFVAGFALALALCGLLITYLESDRVREWSGKDLEDGDSGTDTAVTSGEINRETGGHAG